MTALMLFHLQEEPQNALQLYTRALSVFIWFDRGRDKASEDIPLINSIKHLKDEEHQHEVGDMHARACCLLPGCSFAWRQAA